MILVWTQDRRGVNTIHREGCQHLRLDDGVYPLGEMTVKAAMQEVVDDNIGTLSEGEKVSDFVRVSPCAKGV